MPAWKSTSSSGMTTKRGVGVELAQVDEVEAARLDVVGQHHALCAVLRAATTGSRPR